jgi:hypothetical protein
MTKNPSELTSQVTADPAAWREMAGKVSALAAGLWADDADDAADLCDEAAAALRAAAAAVEEGEADADALQGRLDERDTLVQRLCELLTPEGDRGTLYEDSLLPAVGEMVRERDALAARLADAERLMADTIARHLRAYGATFTLGYVHGVHSHDIPRVAAVIAAALAAPAARAPEGDQLRSVIETATDGLDWLDRDYHAGKYGLVAMKALARLQDIRAALDRTTPAAGPAAPAPEE